MNYRFIIYINSSHLSIPDQQIEHWKKRYQCAVLLLN